MMTCGNSSRRTNMTNTIRKSAFPLIAGIVLLLLSLAGIAAISCRDNQDRKYDLAVYKVDGGWGYDICFDGKPVIHQPFVPAISGNRAFPDRSSALAAGRLVIGKLSSGEGPSLSREEIDGILNENRP